MIREANGNNAVDSNNQSFGALFEGTADLSSESLIALSELLTRVVDFAASRQENRVVVCQGVDAELDEVRAFYDGLVICFFFFVFVFVFVFCLSVSYIYIYNFYENLVCLFVCFSDC